MYSSPHSADREMKWCVLSGGKIFQSLSFNICNIWYTSINYKTWEEAKKYNPKPIAKIRIRNRHIVASGVRSSI